MSGVDWNAEVLDHLLHDPDGEVGQELERKALLVEEAQKRLLSLHGTGRVYRRRRVEHQASAPGEPPAVDTGVLRASIGHVVNRDAEGLYADIGSGASPVIPGVNYAAFLELGTRHMAPRPFLRPSLDVLNG